MPPVVNDAATTVVGIDENGLGPRLGPLVVTAVWASAEGEGRRMVERKPRGVLRQRLGDSKRLVAFGDVALGEAWARALATRGGLTASDPDSLVRALSVDAPGDLRAPCPAGHADQCWSSAGDAFEADPKLVMRVGADLDKLEQRGIRVAGAACVIVCARRLNDAAARGASRFDIDLHAMERLALLVRNERAKRDVVATCGKVGGYDRYPAAFGVMNGWLHAVAAEGRARSEYVVPGLGRIAFVRDADESHLLVCMASLVGKWVRETLMARIVRYHQEADPDLPAASGYHDPVTTRFIAASRLSRERRGVPDDCFERRAVGAADYAPEQTRSALSDPSASGTASAMPSPEAPVTSLPTRRASSASRRA